MNTFDKYSKIKQKDNKYKKITFVLNSRNGKTNL